MNAIKQRIIVWMKLCCASVKYSHIISHFNVISSVMTHPLVTPFVSQLVIFYIHFFYSVHIIRLASESCSFSPLLKCSNPTKLLELKLFMCLNAQSLLNVIASTYKTFKHIIREWMHTAQNEPAIKTCKRGLEAKVHNLYATFFSSSFLLPFSYSKRIGIPMALFALCRFRIHSSVHFLHFISVLVCILHTISRKFAVFFVFSYIWGRVCSPYPVH